MFEGQVPHKALLSKALTSGVSRGFGWDVLTVSLCPAMPWLVWRARLQKERLDGCLLPITLPVTDGLGENAAGALNVLVPVPASGGGRRPCARGLSIRTTLFPYSTIAGARPLVDSHDTLSAFEAMGVNNCASDRGGGVESGVVDLRTSALIMCVSLGTPY